VPPVRLYAVMRPRRGAIRLPRGIDHQRLRLMNVEFGAVVYAESPRVIDGTLEHLRAYDEVIRRLWSMSSAILPARFGTVAESPEQLKSAIADRREPLRAALELVTGCEQMTIRLASSSTVGQQPRRRRGLRRETPGTRYLRARATQSPVEPSWILRSRPGLRDFVKAERIEVTTSGETIYHLIEAGGADRYRALLRQAGLSTSSDAVSATGPFPAYAFVPGIDRAVWTDHGIQKADRRKAGALRSRTDRRDAGDSR
jgi:hypothetical protein